MRTSKPKSIGRKLGLLSLIVLLVASALATNFREQTKGYPVPSNGKTFYGIQLDTQHDSVSAYSERLGATPALVGRYISFPLYQPDLSATNQEVMELAQRHSSLMLTLEPDGGLGTVTQSSLDQLTRELIKWNHAGVPVLVRFGHEMNGSWYPWAQNPTEYVNVFRRVAKAVHKAPESSVLWSPNDGGGYPFAGGPYGAKKGTQAFNVLDTNHDGVLTMADDPYAPYWPGDGAVDWVGLTIYHFGTVYPWGENEVPSANKLDAKISGTCKYDGADETQVPNFYETYANGHNKPFAISETAAFYNSSNPTGASAIDIKSTWWDQLFNKQFLAKYPRLKLAAWFEYRKEERDSGASVIDWRVTDDPQTAKAFTSAIDDRFVMAPINKSVTE